MEAAIAAEAARLAAIEDPAEAVRAVTEAFMALDDALEAVAEPRLRAIAQLYRTSRSYQTVAIATGLSKARVAQLVRAAKQQGF
ncbi:hypothetical protein [Nocardioides sp. URHA0020]|uniref:hypothetical protein n=1 Tax=Nocardioides sp. URHA0020 TaxID=1380392 RepID=UPI000490C693|nr:hypothetical protein [Nocardioides sp. URHA0020]